RPAPRAHPSADKRPAPSHLQGRPRSRASGIGLDAHPRVRTGSGYRRTREGACHVIVRIVPNDKGNPPGKLADAELHFTEGPLEGLKLIGFAVWERRTGGGRNVTFPARSYSVNGERRSFALLRPIVDTTAQSRIRELVLEAFQEYEERSAIAS